MSLISDQSNPPKRPTDVTDANWDELERQGFEWLTNLAWPLSTARQGGSSPRGYVRDLYAQFGGENVKLGYPSNHEGRPDVSFEPQSNMIGVYAKRRI